jgi:hypothetical protein
MANDQPAHHGDAADRPPLLSGLDYADVEAVYLEWLRKYIEDLGRRLPGEPAHSIRIAPDGWARHFAEPAPEEAAKIAAMWWDQHRTLP